MSSTGTPLANACMLLDCGRAAAGDGALAPAASPKRRSQHAGWNTCVRELPVVRCSGTGTLRTTTVLSVRTA